MLRKLRFAKRNALDDGSVSGHQNIIKLLKDMAQATTQLRIKKWKFFWQLR